MGQDSVFIVPSESLEGEDNDTWLSVGSPKSWEDPSNDQAQWITVPIPAEMDDTHTDEAIMVHALHIIRNRQAIVSEVAQHNLEVACISIPVPVSADTETMWAYAEAAARKWLDEIRTGMVTLNREIIFQASHGLLCHSLKRER
jgi:hypothetical protein